MVMCILALVYSPMESAIGFARGKQDLANSIVAASLTGALYKSLGEPKLKSVLDEVGQVLLVHCVY